MVSTSKDNKYQNACENQLIEDRAICPWCLVFFFRLGTLFSCSKSVLWHDILSVSLSTISGEWRTCRPTFDVWLEKVEPPTGYQLTRLVSRMLWHSESRFEVL